MASGAASTSRRPLSRTVTQSTRLSTSVMNQKFAVVRMRHGLVGLALVKAERAMAGRRAVTLVLAEAERTELRALAARRSTAQAMALRARIVLACAEGAQNQDVAARLGVGEQSVSKWRRRFAEQRLEGLRDEPRPGVPRTVDDARIEAVITATLESAPPDATHWSSRGMAAASGLLMSTVQRVWRAFGLQPHRTDTFKLSTDPDFVAKVRDVVGLYVAPPNRALVLCVDEKSQIQALDRSQPVLPMRPGQPPRAATTTRATAPQACSRRWTSPRAG